VCGLCCTGSLHQKVAVRAEHVAVVQGLGLTVEQDSVGKFVFQQPCVLYRDSRCAAYPNHPPTCQSFRCGVLRRYEGGHRSFEESAAIIRVAKDLLAGDTRESLRLASAGGAPYQLLRVAAFDVLLRRYFLVDDPEKAT
jgi:hypothetical protein